MPARLPVIVASISTIVLVALAAVGWMAFTGGFVTFGIKVGYAQLLASLQTLSPAAAEKFRELLSLPYNSHYIVAAISPCLFVVMIVKASLLMVLKAKIAPVVYIILSAFVSFQHKYNIIV
jgi:hypothetical protein